MIVFFPRYTLRNSFGVIGALEEAISLSRDYALNRKQFGVPIASFQLVQKKLADANMEAAIALVSVVQLGRLKDSKNWSRTLTSLLLSSLSRSARVLVVNLVLVSSSRFTSFFQQPRWSLS